MPCVLPRREEVAVAVEVIVEYVVVYGLCFAILN
jgi:hypothetical protein